LGYYLREIAVAISRLFVDCCWLLEKYKLKTLKHPVSFTDTPLIIISEGNKQKGPLNTSPLKWSPPLTH